MKEYDRQPTQELDALGIHFNLAKGTATPTEVTLHDLRDRLEALRTTHNSDRSSSIHWYRHVDCSRGGSTPAMSLPTHDEGAEVGV